MCHYSSDPLHTKFVCGAPIPPNHEPAVLNPLATTCAMCQSTLAWRLDQEAAVVLSVISAGAEDAKAIAENCRIMLAAALNIIERLQRCHQIITDSRGHISRIKAGL